MPYERQFVLEYGAKWCTLDIWAVSVAMAIFAIKLLLMQYGLAANGSAAALWLHIALCAAILMLIAFLGQERYALLAKGPCSICSRMLFAAGPALSLRPNDCRMCPVFWHHRLLWSHIAIAVIRVSSSWYWIGVPVAWLTALLVDLSDPACSCRQSIACITGLVQGRLANPMQLAGDMISSIAPMVYLADVILPGLLLTCLEQVAHKAWLRQRAAAAVAAINRVVSSNMVSCTDSMPQSLHKSADTGAGQEQLLQPQSNSASSSCGSFKGHSNTNSSGQARPILHSSSSSKHTGSFTMLIAPAGAVPAAAMVLITAPAPPASAAAPPTADIAVAEDPATTVLSTDTETAQVPAGYVAANKPITPAQQTSAAPAAPTPSTAELLGASAEETPAGAVPASKPASSTGVMYHSPIRRRFVGVRLQGPDNAGPPELQSVRALVAHSLQSTIRHRNSVPGSSTRPTGSSTVVLEACTFKGSYQLVYEFLAPATWTGAAAAAAAAPMQEMASAAGLSDQYLLGVADDIQEVVEQCLPAGWKLLEIQQHTACTATAAAMRQELRALGTGTSEYQEVDDVTLEPMAVSWPSGLPRDIILASPGSRSSSNGNLGAAAATMATARDTSIPVRAVLQLSKILVQQYISQGYEHVRVVVAERPMGAVLLDESWPLLAGMLAAAPDHHMQLELSFTICTSQGQLLGQNNVSQIQLLSVVVLGDSSSNTCQHSSSGSIMQWVELQAGSLHRLAFGHSKAPILAHLPMLLLPAAAHTELQQLAAALANGSEATGVSIDTVAVAAASQQLLLPLLEDWVALQLLVSDAGSLHSGSQDVAVQALCHSLSEFFAANRMVECSQLLSKERHTPEFHADSTNCAAADDSSVQCDASEPKGYFHESTSTAVVRACNTDSAMVVNSTAAPASSSGHLGANTSTAAVAHSTKAGSNVSEVAISGSAVPGPPHRGLDVASHDAQAANISLSTVLFGYPSAQLEHAYNHWKGVMLQRHDLFLMGLYAVSTALVLLFSRYSKGPAVVPKLVVLANHWLHHSILWVLSNRMHQPTTAGRWRGAVMVAGTMVAARLILKVHRSMHTATPGTGETSFAWLATRHIAQPLLMRVGVFSTVAYLLVIYSALTAVSGWPEIWFMGRTTVGVVCSACSMTLAVLLEVLMRKGFSRHMRGHEGSN